jgi:hypothetical protein
VDLEAEAAVDLNVAAWNATDPSARKDLIKQAFAEDAVMVSGHDVVHGAEAIADFIENVQAVQPVTARRLSAVDAHGGWLRYEWQALDSSGAVVEEGVDFAEQSADGRLQRLIVFHPLRVPAAS